MIFYIMEIYLEDFVTLKRGQIGRGKLEKVTSVEYEERNKGSGIEFWERGLGERQKL